MFLYYTLVIILLSLAGPALLLSTKRRAGLLQKLGAIPAAVSTWSKAGPRPVWFHAVSVGEFNAVWPLIKAFHQKYPHQRIAISTSTATGQKLAQERAGGMATVFYFPLDLPWALNAWLQAINPALVVIVETEIWPGFIHECSRRAVPVVVANGRISPRSFRWYRALRWFFRPFLRSLKAIAAQSEADADRYRAIAGGDLPVVVLGNLKFDGLTPISEAERESLRQSLGIVPEQDVIVAGSTHEGEESAVLEAFAHLLKGRLAHPVSGPAASQLRLILAPRHPERFDQVQALIESCGFRVRRYSRKERFEQEQDVLLIDTIGDLFPIYSLASVAFVGGTLAAIGGHNILEPYAYGTPVVCGPSLEKTREAAQGLTQADALRIALNTAELHDRLSELISSSAVRRQLGVRGRQWLSQSQGAVGKTVAFLDSHLPTPYNTGRPEGKGALIK